MCYFDELWTSRQEELVPKTLHKNSSDSEQGERT